MHFQSPVVTSLRRTALFGLALASAALIGVGRQGSFSFHKLYTHPLERLTSAHCCLVLQGISQHLGYLLSLDFSAVSGLVSYLRDPLRSWWSFSHSMFPKFSEGVPKWSAIFLYWFCTIWRLCSVRSLHVYPIFTPGLRVFYLSSGGASFWGLLIVSKFSLILGFFRSYWKDCSAIASNFPVSFIPALCFYHIDTKKVFYAASLLSDGIFSVAIFPHVLWGGEDKIEVIEEFFSSVIWGFYYRLTLSCGDFSNCSTR